MILSIDEATGEPDGGNTGVVRRYVSWCQYLEEREILSYAKAADAGVMTRAARDHWYNHIQMFIRATGDAILDGEKEVIFSAV